jgi:hypothetical protein
MYAPPAKVRRDGGQLAMTAVLRLVERESAWPLLARR